MPAATKKKRARVSGLGSRGSGKAQPPALQAPAPAPEPGTRNPNPELQHITPSLHALAVPVESLKPDPRNVRLHDERNLASITASLTRSKQQKPIVVDADGIVLAGNGTLAAAKALGWTHIAVSRSDLRGAEARAFAISDNRTAELAAWDADELVAQLDELADVGIKTEDLAFTSEELDDLLEQDRAALDEPAAGNAVAKSGGGDLSGGYKIVVTCNSEGHQAELLERFAGEGLKVRSLG